MTTDDLLAQLKHPNPHLRQRASIELAETQPPDAIAKLMNNLSEEDTVYRRASVKTLGMMGRAAIAPLAQRLLESDDPTVQSSCTKAMAQFAVNYPEETFPQVGLDALKIAVMDENPVVHITAAMALGEIGEQALEIVTEALRTTENLSLAVSLANALGAIGTAAAAQTLSAVAEDDAADDYVRQTAKSALSRIGSFSALS